MRLTVAGAGPAYTDRAGATGAAYVLDDGLTRLLVDLGQGSLPRVFPVVRPEDLAAVVISHLHPDHFIDLVALRHYLRFQFEPPRRLRVLGPADLPGRLDALHAAPGFTGEALDCETLGEAERRIGSLTVRAALVWHTDESYGIRVAPTGGGPGLVYSGDCGRASDLAPLIAPGDTLLSEVSFGPGPVPPGAPHLDGPAIGVLAARSGVARVLLTHLQMGFDPDETVRSVQAHFGGPVEFVWPGSELDA